MTMDVAALNSWMERHFTRSAFRLETMQTYEVAADGTDYRRYLDGEPTWTPERKQPWLDTLAAEAKRGLRRSRVRIVTRPVSDYTRYECEWGYAPNVAAGEDVRILDLGERDMPAVGELADRDWWIVVDDGGTARTALMLYDAAGQFIGAQEASDTDPYRAAAVELWAASEPFLEWWRRHPELHRNHRAA